MAFENFDLQDALAAIPSDEYNDWLTIGHALYQMGEPFGTFDSWSATSTKYRAEDVRRKWDSFASAAPLDAEPVKVIHAKAKEHGYVMPRGAGGAAWREITREPRKPAEAPDVTQTIAYLKAVYRPDEVPRIVTTATYNAGRGKWDPADNGGWTLTAQQICEKLEAAGSIEKALGVKLNPEAGAWITPNTYDGEGAKAENVVTWRYTLIESDDMPKKEQIAAYDTLGLPIAALVDSGGKSIHAVVKLDAATPEEYEARRAYLYNVLGLHGFTLDGQNKNPGRLSRLPGVVRGGKLQRLISTDIGAADWCAWVEQQRAQDEEADERAARYSALAGEAQDVYITFSEADALAIEAAGGVAVHVPSKDEFFEQLALVPDAWGKRYHIAPSWTGQGIASARALVGLVEAKAALWGVSIVADVLRITGNGSSPADAAAEAPEDFAFSVSHVLPLQPDRDKLQHMAKTVWTSLDGFDGVPTDGIETIPTGYPQLDHITGGGLSGLVLLFSGTGCGKTTMALSWAANIAKSGRDVLYVSLEMSRAELTARLISAATWEQDNEKAYTARQVLDPRLYSDHTDPLTGETIHGYGLQTLSRFEDARASVAEYGHRITVLDGMGDMTALAMREAMETHTALRHKAPVLIVDYAQIIAPPEGVRDPMDAVDRNILELKRISRDFGVPVVVLSSTAREKYLQAVEVGGGKASGSLEYTADIVLGLQIWGQGGHHYGREVDKNGNPKLVKHDADWMQTEKRRPTRYLDLCLLKSRYSEAGLSVPMDYIPKYNIMRETWESNSPWAKDCKKRTLASTTTDTAPKGQEAKETKKKRPLP